MGSLDVTFTTHDGNIIVLPVAAEDAILKVKTFVAELLGLSAAQQQQFVFEGVILDESRTLASYSIKSGDLVLVEPRRVPVAPAPIRPTPAASSARSAGSSIDWGSLKGPDSLPKYKSGATEDELRRTLFGLLGNAHQMQNLEARNPELAARIKDGDIHAVDELVVQWNENDRRAKKEIEDLRETLKSDPNNTEAKDKLEAIENQDAVQENMMLAMEHTPEVFGSVVMLYIDCAIGGIKCKAFVDSGAQFTIINEDLARRTNIYKLLDRRFAGVAAGVGTSKILGRIHSANLDIGGAFLPCCFNILENQDMELLIGLDMLRRHRCCIDLKDNVLRIETGGVNTPFLPESEFPEWSSAKRQRKALQDMEKEKETKN